jgi:hypothetical protein
MRDDNCIQHPAYCLWHMACSIRILYTSQLQYEASEELRIVRKRAFVTVDPAVFGCQAPASSLQPSDFRLQTSDIRYLVDCRLDRTTKD